MLFRSFCRINRSRHAEAETEALIRTTITSPKFLQSVVQSLDLHHNPSLFEGEPVPTVLTPEREKSHIAATARQIEKLIRIRSTDRFIYQLRARHTDPDLTFALVNEIIERFLAEEQATRLEQGESERDFLSGQRELYETNLQEAQNNLAQFQQTVVNSNLMGNPVSESNLSMAGDQLNRLRSQIQSDRQGKMISLRQQALAALPAVDQFLRELKREPSLATLVQELTGFELDQAVHEFTDGGRNADQALLGTSRVALDGIVERRVQEEYSQLNVVSRTAVSGYLYDSIYLEILQGAVDGLNGHIRAYRNFMTRQPEQSATLSRLMREVQSAQDMLQTLDQDIRRQNLSLAANMSAIGYQIEIYDEPRRPLYPVEPDKKRLGMMGAALALAIGMGLVVLAEMLDRSFKTVPQIEKALGVPVIGTLPQIKDGPFEAYRRRRIMKWILIILAIIALAALGLLWVYPTFIA